MLMIRRSETTVLAFQRKDTDGNVILEKPAALCFSVKKDYRGKDALILKDLENGGIVFDAETGWYRIRILPEDTEKLDFGKYFFDIRKKDDSGEKYLCPMTELEICPVVTHRENMR